jgi:hypothetical protein
MLLIALYPAFSRLSRFNALSLAYRSLPRFFSLIALYPFSPVYIALRCFLPLIAFYRAFSRFTALYPHVKLICFILLYANPFAFSPPYAKLPYNFSLAIFFLYLSLHVFIVQIFSRIASTFHNLYASLCPASLKPFRYCPSFT